MKTGSATRKQECLLTHSIPVNQVPTQGLECGQCLLNMNPPGTASCRSVNHTIQRTMTGGFEPACMCGIVCSRAL